ncbi:hypothetical protein K0B96_05315 [Horticoccus luteus]|uniref:Uncharacterized protein n=1 Tax=Horticoccus luteus TaxID=2862869 RepID=A0A8F9TVV7_9BACT|nr:hypothetical protein [Horticoccus luteus]QYM80040.1 hypothetical protein K0B96_05315 [Horticoccus luteus]
MESPNLTPLPPDDPLEQILSARLAGDLPDDGFTPRVLAALPPPARSFHLSRRAILVGVGIAAGAFFAWQRGAVGPGLADWRNLLAALSDHLIAQSAELAAAATLSGPVLISAAAVAAALFLALRPQSTGEPRL